MSGSDNHKPRVVLASRRNGGLRVTLLWAADTNTVAVRVRDEITNEQFELLVEPEANPIDVYEHPYAHAAWRGVDYRTVDLRRRLKASEATHDMDATTLATETTRYLDPIDLLRSQPTTEGAHDVNAEAHDTPHRFRHRLTAPVTGCA